MTDPAARLKAHLADRYQVERELGFGGMATVYLARDLRHDRRVALKVLRPELAAVLSREAFASRELSWVSPGGRIELAVARRGYYTSVGLASDGRKIAASLDGDIWVFDLDADLETQLTRSELVELAPVWHPGGLVLYYAQEGSGTSWELVRRALAAPTATVKVQGPRGRTARERDANVGA